MERLQKYIASCGVASRRAAEELIADGKVTVNGQVVTKMGTTIDPEKDAIKYLKDSIEHSYGKKGKDIVEMNWKAVDAGIDGCHLVEVPAAWKARHWQ